MKETNSTAIFLLKIRLQQRAERKGLEFYLSTEVCTRLLSQPACGYCSRDFNQDTVYRTIDRIDAALGYVPENVAAVCDDCNQLKSRYEKDRSNRRKPRIRRERYTYCLHCGSRKCMKEGICAQRNKVRLNW